MARDKVPRILQMLDDISNVVNSLDDSDQVCNSLVELVCDTMNVATCSIMLIDPETQVMTIKVSKGLARNIIDSYQAKVGEGIAGFVAATGEPLLVPDVEKDPRFAPRRIADGKRYNTRSLLSVPLILHDRPVGVINVNNKLDGSAFDAADEAVLRVVARFVTIALDKAQMREIILQKERIDAELDAARRIQELILPRDFQAGTDVEVVARNLPARTVAGDFYDVIHSPTGELWITIGDVCGKGLGAALYMARVVGYFRAVCAYHRSPAELVTGVNEQLAHESTDVTFVTACVMMLDKDRETLTLTAAGHHAPLYFNPADRSVTLFESRGGPPLGVEAGASFDEVQRAFLPGERFLMYTDGITEAANGEGELFGLDRVREIMAARSDDGDALLESLIEAVNRFAGSEARQDDLTLITLRKLPSPEG